jgi:pimeloyl-ACP methyl ester carboxylesterase
MQTMTLHGDRIAYLDEGSGEVLVLIHGMGGSSSSWRELVPKLATKYRVIAPDLLGHGQSDKPRGDYSVGAFAVWLRDLLDTLGIPKATIVGHSLGGGIAMQFAHQHRDYCQRLILISSGGLGGDVGSLLRIMSLPGSELLLTLLASRPVLLAGNALRIRLSIDGKTTRFSETLRAQEWLTDRDSRAAFLRTLRSVVDRRGQSVCALSRLHRNSDLPSLIITGDQDRVIPVAHAHAAHAALPDSRLYVLPDVYHHPHAECPDTVVALIDDFIGATAGYSVHSARPEPVQATCRTNQRVVHMDRPKSSGRSRIALQMRSTAREDSAIRRSNRRRARG